MSTSFIILYDVKSLEGRNTIDFQQKDAGHAVIERTLGPHPNVLRPEHDHGQANIGFDCMRSFACLRDMQRTR